MKLYATTTSERASKGQGGEWLDINLQDDRKVTFAIIKVRKEEGLLIPTIEIESIGQIKGEKKKGEIWDTMDKEYPKGFIL